MARSDPNKKKAMINLMENEKSSAAVHKGFAVIGASYK